MIFLLACASGPGVDVGGAPALAPAGSPPTSTAGGAPAGATPVAAPVGVSPPTDRQPLALTPRLLYEGCRDAVEGAGAPGECTKDEDCAAGGCSGEVCVKAGTDVVSVCTVLPCFEVLDRCGCVEGQCSWSLKIPHNVGAGVTPATVGSGGAPPAGAPGVPSPP